jgi:hypothetical protein
MLGCDMAVCATAPGEPMRARPQTPVYPPITAAFSSAIWTIARGNNVQQALEIAVSQVDGNLAANGFHKASEP